MEGNLLFSVVGWAL